MQDAIKDKYTAAIINEYTNLITMNIPTALEYLLYNFRKVTSEEVTQKEIVVMSMTWQLSNAVTLLIRLLEKLKKLASHTGIPCTSV